MGGMHNSAALREISHELAIFLIDEALVSLAGRICAHPDAAAPKSSEKSHMW